MKQSKRKRIHRLISIFLSLCMFMSMFAGVDLTAKASVWRGGSMGDNGATWGSRGITATGSWYADRYTFTPSRTGVYRFYSGNKSQGDPYIEIADSQHYTHVEANINSAEHKNPTSCDMAYNDDSNGNLNFLVYVFMEKGKNYYIFNTRYSGSAAYTTYWDYMGSGQITLNKQGGTGGSSYLYGGRSGYSPSKSSYDSWFAVDSYSNASSSYISVPTRTGYAFEGYYTGTNGTGTQLINSSGYINHNAIANTFSSNGTLYAKWRALYSTYNLNKNGGTGGQNSVIAFQNSTLPTLSSLPTKTGYDFTGYYTTSVAADQNETTRRYKANGTSTYTNTTANQTFTLYAGWQAKDYSVVLNANGGSGGLTKKMTYDAQLPEDIAAPVKKGYNFLGYYYGNTEYYDETMHRTPSTRKWTFPTDGIQLVARWSPISYNIQLFSCDDVYGVGDAGNKASGYVDTINDVVYGDMVLPSAEELGLSRDHYDFVGWNIYDEQDWAMFKPYKEYHTGLVDAQGQTAQLYAAWQMKDNFTITYSLNGGTGNYPRSQTVFKGDTLTLTDTVPTYEDHSFLGWYTTPNGQGDGPYFAGQTFSNITENKTFYARWKEDNTVSYNANGGSFTTVLPTQYQAASSTVSAYLPGVDSPKGFDRTLTEADMPVRVGYQFLGWSTSPTATTAEINEGSPTFTMSADDNMILYAVWKKDVYSISYAKDEAGMGADVAALITIQDNADSVEYGDDYSFTIKFDERKVEASGLTVTINDVVVTNPVPTDDTTNSNIKLYTYTINSAISNQSIVIGGVAEKQYSVTYVEDGGLFDGNATVTREYSFHETEKVTLPTGSQFTKTGYKFEGWYETSNLSGSAVTEFSKSVAEDKTFYAKWTPITYTIQFDKGSPLATVANPSALAAKAGCVYDTSVTLASPTDSDITCGIGQYKFDLLGWSTTQNAIAAEYNLGEIVRNLTTEDNTTVTLYAVWNIPSYTVSFDLNGGESAVIPTQIVQQGNDVTFPAEPTRTGYTFAGWKDTSDGTTVSSITGINRDYTLEAQWTANTYSVTYQIVVPTDGKLMTNDTPAEDVAEGDYSVSDTTYHVTGDGSVGNPFVIKTDSDIVYDTAYSISAMPFVMHDEPQEEYDQYLTDRTTFKAYLDDVALYYAWQAYETINEQWDTNTSAWKTLGTAYTTAELAWQHQLAAAKAVALTNGSNRAVNDEFTTYLEVQYTNFISRPEQTATTAPTEPSESKPDAEPTNIEEPTIISQPATTVPTTFLGWNTDKDATNVSYLANGSYTNLCTGTLGDNTVTLYAIYGTNAENYLFYDANGGTWPDGALAPQTKDDGDYATISNAKQPTRVGYTFGGWSLDGTGSGLTSVSLADGHQTVKAIWTPVTYKVYFDRNDTGSHTDRQPIYNDDGTESGSYQDVYYTGIVDVQQDEVAPQNMTYGTAVNLQDNSYTSNNNYEFLGWSTDANATRATYTDKQSVKNLPYTWDTDKSENSIRLYALWKKKDAFIRFNANGGSGEPNSIFRTGSETSFALPTGSEAPSRAGYTFKGWALSPDAGTPDYVATVTDGQVASYAPSAVTATSKTVLYAVWEETPYCTIEYVKADGATGAVPTDSTKYYLGDSVTVDFSKLPVKAGYHFSGWKNGSTVYSTEDGGASTITIAASDFAAGVTENKITLTEQLAPNNYTVEFYARSYIDKITFTYDADTPDISDIMAGINSQLGTEIANYTFKGWSLVNGGGVSYTNDELKNLSVAKDGEVKLYAVLKAKEVTLTFDNQDGTENTTMTATYGEVLPAVGAVPTKTGYNFGGYYTTQNPADGTPAVYDAALNTSGNSTFNTDTTLYAKWIPKTYRLIYIYEGETLYTDAVTYKPDVAEREMLMANSSVFPTGVIVSGATKLYGWSRTGQNNGEVVYRVGTGYKYDMWTEGGGNDIILYPIIVDDKKVSVTYNANGGTGIPIDDTEYQAGDQIAVLFNKIPTKDNYVFAGWSIDPNLDVADIGDSYTDTFYPYDKDGVNDYRFTAERDTTLYAVWKKGTYNITYKSNVADAQKPEEVSNVLTVEKGSDTSRHAGEIYTREGYVLQGWSTSKNINNAVIYDLDSEINTILTTKDNIDLYTVWRPADVVVTFDTVGGNSISEVEVTYDSNYGVLPAPEREGYTFEGWYASYDAETGEYASPITATTKVESAQRHVLYAKWTESTFTIKYHTNFDEDEIISQSYNVNQDTVLMEEEAFARQGHDLLGYAASANGPVVYTAGQSMGEGWASKGAVVHLYCVWDVETTVEVEPTQSYIYYVSNGATNGLAPACSIYTTDKTATIQDNTGNMSKYGYYFNGWNTEPDGSGMAYAPGDTVKLSKSLILFADWRIDDYKLFINKDSGVETVSVSPEKEFYTYGEAVTVTATVKDGFIWNGFVSDNENDVPSSCGETAEDGSFVYTFKMSGTVARLTASTKVDLQLDANGGSYEDGTSVKSYQWDNDALFDTELIETPSKGAGYNFLGWFKDAACNKPWNEEELISEKTTLYAGWGYVASKGEMNVLAIGDQIYTGTALKPQVIVTDGSRVLKEGTDYTVTYKNNKNVNKDGKYVSTNALMITENSIDAQNVDTKLPYVIIKGKGNYNNTIQMNFNIYPKDLSKIDTDDELNLYYDQYIATPKKDLKPSVVLSYTPETGKQQTLKLGKDYTVTYTDATGNTLNVIPKGASGKFVMTVTATEGGQYANSFTKEINVVNSANDFVNAKITIKAATIVNDMTADNLGITVKMGKVTLKQGTDFTAEFVDGAPKTPGTYMVRIKPVEGSSYTGTGIGKVVLKAASLKKATVNILTDAVYSGEDYGDGIVSIVDNGVTLTKGVDYTTTYKGGINAGKVDVTINGQGIYKGTSRKVSYKIEPYDLSVDLEKLLTVISPSEAAEYSNTGAVPDYTVLFGTTELRNGVDFKASYLNNMKLTSEYALSRPQIVIEGIGNFKGKINGGSFAIVQKNFTQDNMTVAATGITYKENSVLNVKFNLYEAGGKKALKAGTDYDKNHITYTCNGEKITKCPPIGSEVTVTVNGIGNYTGTYSFSVFVGGNTINKAKNLKVTKTYTGEEITLTSDELGLTYKIANAAEAEYFNQIGTYVKAGETQACNTLKAKDTIMLTAGRDYDLEDAVYTNNVKKGKATVTINGKGFFIGSKKIGFTIENKSLKWWEKE